MVVAYNVCVSLSPSSGDYGQTGGKKNVKQKEFQKDTECPAPHWSPTFLVKAILISASNSKCFY